jgi:phenylpropionate dioxygenase-like ring-hydroxylating dioxygenase large terminal subunit
MATADTAYLGRAAAVVPAGWYRVPSAAQPGAGLAAPAVLAGQDLALWRTADGALVAHDAHCPHFGAHLGHGGQVAEDCLTCPFHGWRYDAGGAHVGYPYGEGSTSAQLRLWPTRHVDGTDLVWWSPDRDQVPWEPTALTADVPEGAQLLGELEAEGEGLHLAMMEGIVDVAHFPTLHGISAPEVDDLDFGDGPTAGVTLRLDSGAVARLGFDGLTRIRERMDHGDYTLWMVGEYWLTGPDTAVGQVRFWGTGPRPAGVERLYRTFRRVYEHQAADDEHIWRHRRYGAAQAYGPDDRPVVAFRRWAAQFFPGDP